MNEALIQNIGLSANKLRREQEVIPVFNHYVLKGISTIGRIQSRLFFPETGSLNFDSEKMLIALLAADLSEDLDLLKASYPHYRNNPVFGYGIVARSIFATNLDNGGNIVSTACRALGITVDLLKDVPGYASTGQTRYHDGSTPSYVLNDDYIHKLIESARKF